MYRPLDMNMPLHKVAGRPTPFNTHGDDVRHRSNFEFFHIIQEKLSIFYPLPASDACNLALYMLATYIK